MMFVWHLYWPAVAAAFVIAVIAGRSAFRSAKGPTPTRPARRAIGLGLLASLAAVALWHGPLGASQRYARPVEAAVRAELIHLEVPSISARLQRGPLRRTILLEGRADDFQRPELVRIVGSMPGVSTARWAKPPLGRAALLPLIAEALLMGLIGFGFGLLLAWLLELRRRSNAQWSW